MPLSSSTEHELKTASEFIQIYDKWFKELVSIEENLLMKADEIQLLQNSLNSEADTVKRLNENLVQTQVEQKYMEDLLNVLIKEQEELQREISKLDENIAQPTEADSNNYEECSVLFESLDAQLKTVKEKVKDLVQKINKKDTSGDSENPFPIYRMILDHYADALQLLDSNTVEMQEKFNALHDICLNYIPSDIFASP